MYHNPYTTTSHYICNLEVPLLHREEVDTEVMRYINNYWSSYFSDISVYDVLYFWKGFVVLQKE